MATIIFIIIILFLGNFEVELLEVIFNWEVTVGSILLAIAVFYLILVFVNGLFVMHK